MTESRDLMGSIVVSFFPSLWPSCRHVVFIPSLLSDSLAPQSSHDYDKSRLIIEWASLPLDSSPGTWPLMGLPYTIPELVTWLGEWSQPGGHELYPQIQVTRNKLGVDEKWSLR